MWKNINRKARANPLFLWLANLLVVLALTYATGETAPLMSHWQYDLVWFLIATGWIAVAVALTLLSLNLWAEFDARLRDRRQAREDVHREREKERQDFEEKREDRENKHQLAVKIWQECKDDIALMRRHWDADNMRLHRDLTYRLASKLRGLDPYLDDYQALDGDQERMWATMVGDIIERTDPSADTLERIRTKARITLERF